MKQRWRKRQIQQKVDMFTKYLSIHPNEADEKALLFFTEKLNVMKVKNTKSITIEMKQLFNLQYD